MDLIEVTCPSCFEAFSVPTPAADECPVELDYDCEICCRPLVIDYDGSFAQTRSLDDL